MKNIYEDRVLGLTRSVARHFAIIRGERRAKGQLIGQTDLLIAATAIQYNLILVTRNHKDFARIPDLQLYRASEPVFTPQFVSCTSRKKPAAFCG